MTNIDNTVPAEDKTFYLEIDGQLIYVSEEVYRAYKQPLWKEHKRQERQRRCRFINDKGSFARCDKPCSECQHFKNGDTLLLDEMQDDTDLAEEISKNLLYEEMWKEVSKLKDSDQEILILFSKGYSEREIADIIGISQAAINKRLKKANSILKEKLEKFR